VFELEAVRQSESQRGHSYSHTDSQTVRQSDSQTDIQTVRQSAIQTVIHSYRHPQESNLPAVVLPQQRTAQHTAYRQSVYTHTLIHSYTHTLIHSYTHTHLPAVVLPQQHTKRLLAGATVRHLFVSLPLALHIKAVHLLDLRFPKVSLSTEPQWDTAQTSYAVMLLCCYVPRRSSSPVHVSENTALIQAVS
jgi:hypothetical protein